MQILRGFSVIIVVVLITASSGNIYFKAGNTEINTRAPVIDSILLSIEDKSTFSSLLQTISAEEQVQQEVDQEENGKDSHSVMKIEKEQDRGQSEGESSIGQEQVQQDNKHEDKEKLLPGEGEASLDNKEYNNDGKNPVPMEEQNNSLSSGSHNTKDKAQNSAQNLTDSHSTAATNKNNASFDESHQYANASSAEEVSFILKCDEGAEMVPGTEDSITCTIENKTPKPIELVLGCSGLDSTGIECHIHGEHSIGGTLINEMSHTNFSVLLISRSSPPTPVGSYPFTISAEECINSDLC
jgi:hypothetical protein